MFSFNDIAQFCVIDSQFIFLALAFQDTSSVGQLVTYLTVSIDSWQGVKAKTYKDIEKVKNIISNYWFIETYGEAFFKEELLCDIYDV